MKRLLFCIFVCLSFIPSGFSATIYLDLNATSCTGGGSSDADYNATTQACGSGSDTVFAGNFPYQAGQALSTGDTLYIRTGEYYQDVTGEAGYGYHWGSLYITDDNVTISNYNGETVWIKGGSSKTSVSAHPNNAVFLGGTGSKLSGTGGAYAFYSYGGIIVGGTNNTIEHMDLSGGWDHQSPIGGDAWYDVIRFNASVNALIKDNKIHDNFNHQTNCGGASTNRTLLMHEHDQNTIIENNHFYNSLTNAISTKYASSSGTTQATVRYNFFVGSDRNEVCSTAYEDGRVDGAAEAYDKPLLVYQNIFVNTGPRFSVSMQLGTAQLYELYNNTVYCTNTGANQCALVYSWQTNAAEVFNNHHNIAYLSSSANQYGQRVDDSSGIGGGYYDYNTYYSDGTGGVWQFFTGSTRDFSSWVTWLGNSTGAGANSGTSDPGFNPDDSTLDGDDPTDFKRSSYADGRGAYLTGSETIGLLSADATAPTVTSASVNGPTVTINFSEVVVTTGYDAGDFDLDCTNAGQNLFLTSPSGSGTTRTFTIPTSVGTGDTCNLDYTGSTDDIEDSAGNDLATFSNTSVTVTASGSSERTMGAGSAGSVGAGAAMTLQ